MTTAIMRVLFCTAVAARQYPAAWVQPVFRPSAPGYHVSSLLLFHSWNFGPFLRHGTLSSAP